MEYIKTTIEFGLKRKEYKQEILKFLKEIIEENK